MTTSQPAGAMMDGDHLSEHTQWSPNSLMGRITPDTRERFLKLGAPSRVDSAKPIIREGEPGEYVVLLYSALVKVTSAVAGGRHALLAIRASGDLVGEMSALSGAPRSATVTTCRPSVVYVIRRNSFRSFLHEYPTVAIEVASVGADRLRWANKRRVDFMEYPVKVRLARVLVEIGIEHGHPVAAGLRLDIRLTHEELATLCGAAEVTLQKAMRQLREAHIISTERRGILIRDMTALLSLSELDPE
jgi:CRP/FNR family transcriptional regulator, cyclic AMP receptor protein